MRSAATHRRRRRSTATLGVLLAMVAAAHAVVAGALEAQVTREGRVLHVRATLRAEAPPALCYAVLADFDRLADFVPGLVSSQVISAPGQPVLLRQVGEASAGPFDYTLDVTLAVHETPPQRIEFERTDGNLRQMKGNWTVSGDGDACDIGYRADMEPDFWVPPLIGPRLMRKRVETQLEGVLAEIHRRAAFHAAP